MSIKYTDIVDSLPASVPFVGPEAQERANSQIFRARIGANESVFGPSAKAIQAIQKEINNTWQYGDPENFVLNDCSTQRNLSEKGIQQSKKIGEFFRVNKIEIDAVLSSEWCRCKDTAFHAFENFITFNALNSFYDPKFSMNEELQIIDLKKFIENWESSKNLILVTHYVVISSMLKVGSSSGEIIVVNKDLEILGRMQTF